MKKFQLKRIGTNDVICNFNTKVDATDEMTDIIEENN